MRRREFITLLGGAATAWPLAATAQQAAVPVIGFLGAESPEMSAGRVHAFRQGLGETGYVEGRNVTIEYRWAYDQYDRFPALAAELIRRQVNVIATIGNAATSAAKAATTTIPIVFNTGSDPVQFGFVSSLNRPGGNLTGFTSLAQEVGPKRLELLGELFPSAGVFAYLVNPNFPDAETLTKDIRSAARTLGLQLHVLHASADGEIDAAFATLVKLRASGLVIGVDGFLLSRSEQLAAQALRHAMPTIFQNREFVAAGGLMSYGSSTTDALRLIGIYTGRILKGDKPADLPVQQATRIELIINMKTAKALGLTFPLTLLGRADEVIE